MTFWDFLVTPQGVQLEHAFIVLIVAVAGYFSYLAHRTSKTNKQMLNSHLAEHVRLAKHLHDQAEPHAGD